MRNDVHQLCVFGTIAQNFLLAATTFSVSFLDRMASTPFTYRLGAVPCLKFLATENMPQITVKLHTVDYSRQ